MTLRRPDLWELCFPGTSGRVLLDRDPALLAALQACLTGWEPQIRPATGTGGPILAAIARGRQGWHLTSRFLDAPTGPLPLASVVCALLADLAQDRAETLPGGLGLHCGALDIGGRLLLLTGSTRAGKSTLVTRLAAEAGVRLYCDDVLPVTAAGRGVALGIAPRLRLPAPTGSAVLADLCRSAMPLADDRYGYIRLPNQAPHGTEAPPGAVVLLDRREGAAARLHDLDPAEAVATLLHQTITGFASAGAAFARARQMTAGLPCLRLVYSDLEEAAALILRCFGRECRLPDAFAPAPPLPAPPPARGPESVAPDQPFARTPGVVLRRHGTGAFLWQPGEAMLWQLNEIAGAIWQMLEIPGSAADLTAALAGVFPGTPAATIAADTRALLAELLAGGLIRPAQ